MTTPNTVSIAFYQEDSLSLSREQLQEQGLTAQELGIVVYIYSTLNYKDTEPGIDFWDVLLRFSEDDPISLLISIKRLIKKGYLSDEPKLNKSMLELIKERHGISSV
jgi:hypothetical protein